MYAIGFFANSKLSQTRPTFWLQVPHRVFILLIPKDFASTPIFPCHCGINSVDTLRSSFRYQSLNTFSLFMRVLCGRTYKIILLLFFKLTREGVFS